LAIKSKQQVVGQYLVGLNKFDMVKQNKRSGFNYFSYAVVKGQMVIAKSILQQGLAQGKAQAEFCNPSLSPAIAVAQGANNEGPMNLLQLCL